jgi:hypothetical protein
MTISRSALLLVMVALCADSKPARSAELNDGFNSEPLNTAYWDPCQVDVQRLLFSEVDFGGDKRKVIVNTVDPNTGKPDTCPDGQVAFLALQSLGIILPDADIDSSESLGESLVPAQDPSLSGPAQCPPGDKENFQRNELRPWQKRPDLTHDFRQPHWYSIVFGTDGDIPACGSARWVITQWKQSGVDSPVIAQRYDNGVLHVTVESANCRCVVAQATGDPDAIMSALSKSARRSVQLEDHGPIKCDCPSDLQVLTDRGDYPLLPDPKRNWTTMTYFMQQIGTSDALLDIYANNQFLARVTGLIGDSRQPPTIAKFKFGHYRDGIPGTASLSVDSLCYSQDMIKCAPELTPVPLPQ